MKSYGIKFCREVLNALRDEEDKMFEKFGYGFVHNGRAHRAEIEYKRLLAKFENERKLGVKPTYTPDIHGELQRIMT